MGIGLSAQGVNMNRLPGKKLNSKFLSNDFGRVRILQNPLRPMNFVLMINEKEKRLKSVMMLYKWRLINYSNYSVIVICLS